ncbi:hypothetical protein AZE01_15145 [Escherichia coli]|nr:hypothetical protein BHS89_07545 [Escherichia coli]ORT19047.1 hypothetical protein BGP71_07535 [Escherichia coli]ORT23486.1 hypothetical protein BGP70_07060 [Escherichia coli]OWX84704.1 hypothetical protein BIQ87_07085 [Escherichia coli]OWX85622.1 hypothetical protein BIQ86_07685 [Escherichia coli]
MGSLLISHTTCLNWYDRLANFNTPTPCFDQLLMINEQFYEKSVARIMVLSRNYAFYSLNKVVEHIPLKSL